MDLPSGSAPGPLVEARGVVKEFGGSEGALRFLHQHKPVRAVDGLDLCVERGQIFGLIGESGSGKSTTARLVMGLEAASEGRITFDGKDLSGLSPEAKRSFRRRAQMVFQDPYESMNPGMTVQRLVTEPLLIHGIGSKAERVEAASQWLEKVGLSPATTYLNRFPYELSGGQRQRVAIARALILGPVFVAADEPTSMLDVSVRAGILNLLLALHEEMNLSYLFITHDLSVARYACDVVGVMYQGRLVERGPSEEIVRNGLHPYTHALLSVVAGDDLFRAKSGATRTTYDLGGARGPGCRFAPRCSRAASECLESEPGLIETMPGHYIACHYAEC